MKILKEFREFAVKGNVIDLAVGVIIGSAFGKIVTSLVEDVIMPPLGILIGKVDFSQLKLILQAASVNGAQKVPEVSIKYGMFLQNVFNFLIVAFAIFGMVQLINRLKRAEEKKDAAAEKEEIILLREIRDALKKK